VLYLQRRYNREFPSIYNTYQCYLRDTYDRVVVDMERARREKFLFAAKAVRGAYMVQERKRAADMKYADPIQPNINGMRVFPFIKHASYIII
jgi:proline dehydrogenase